MPRVRRDQRADIWLNITLLRRSRAQRGPQCARIASAGMTPPERMEPGPMRIAFPHIYGFWGHPRLEFSGVPACD